MTSFNGFQAFARFPAIRTERPSVAIPAQWRWATAAV
jgi:hypothetical protein